MESLHQFHGWKHHFSVRIGTLFFCEPPDTEFKFLLRYLLPLAKSNAKMAKFRFLSFLTFRNLQHFKLLFRLQRHLPVHELFDIKRVPLVIPGCQFIVRVLRQIILL